jgi:hypothetical protein
MMTGGTVDDVPLQAEAAPVPEEGADRAPWACQQAIVRRT